MYFSLAFTLVSLLSLTAAAPGPPARVSTSRGIAVAIAKRGPGSSSLNGVVDTSKLLSGIRHSVMKFQEGFATYERNTGEPHPLSLSGSIPLSRRDTGSIPLTNHIVPLWTGNIYVGTPAKSFSVVFDTGSSDLFLPSPGCVNCSGHTLYDPSASSTAQDLSKTFSLTFGGGSTAGGEQFTDVVNISGLTAKSQTLGAATRVSGFGSDFPADGLMGMAFQSISEFNAPPVFQTLISEGVLTSNIFGFKIATSGSELYLGGTNSKLYTGNFTWVPLTNQSYWLASFNSISVNGKSVIGSKAAIFDTGTVEIIGDPASIATLFGTIDGARPAPQTGTGPVSLYTIPCTFNTSVSIDVGGRVVSIPPAVFNLGPVSEGSSTCVAGAAAISDLTGIFWILGEVFLQNVYSAWDVGGSRIGFATLA